jgi:predicted ATPase
MTPRFQLQKLILERFRSIKSAVFPLKNDLTFLVGKNGSGKSNIVDAFQFLSSIFSVQLPGAISQNGGMESLWYKTPKKGRYGKFGMAVEGKIGHQSFRYAFQLKPKARHSFEVIKEESEIVSAGHSRQFFKRDGLKFTSNVDGLKQPPLEPQYLALPLVGGAKPFAPFVASLSNIGVYQINPFQLREHHDPDGGTRLKYDGSNAASVLQEIKRQNDEDCVLLNKFLSKIVPTVESVDPLQHGKKLTLKFTQSWLEEAKRNRRITFEAFSMSEGTLRAVGVLLAIFQHPTPSLLVIEEPESTIHPGAIESIMDAIKFATSRVQVVVTTHSPDVLDQKWVSPDSIRVVEWSGETKIGMLGEANIKSLQNNLMGIGEMMRANGLEHELFISEKDAPLFDGLPQ